MEKHHPDQHSHEHGHHSEHRPHPDLPPIHVHVKVENNIILEDRSERKPIFALTILINNQLFIMSDIVLVPNTPKAGVFTLFDSNLSPITSASFSNQQIGANSNPEVATFAADPNNPNAPIGTPVAASGSGTIVFTTDATWNAPDGSPQSGSFTVTKKYSVGTAGVTFDVVFP